MAITDPLVLPEDVLLLPVADLPEETRRLLTYDEGDYAVTRPRARTPSRIVDAGAADLLRLFREPVTIVEAVIRFSKERKLDPETTLEEAYPLLERLLSSGFLVAEGSGDAEAIRQTHQAGDSIAGFEVVECVQGLEDTELYQVRTATGSTSAALKIERPVAAGRSGGAFEREAAILGHLAGEGAPRLLSQGDVEGRRYLAIEWHRGVDAFTAATELRRSAGWAGRGGRGGRSGRGGRLGLLDLARSIVDAYIRLHARSVVHGDVHPRNILVSASGEARLIDFGIARWEGLPEGVPKAWRGGIAFYFEPEYATPTRAGQTAPEATEAGDQYSLGAILYQLFTGTHYRDFSLEKDTMLRQISEEPPLPFVERGTEAWPEVEAIVGRMLAKRPEDRFPSMAALAEALAAVDRESVPAAPVRTMGDTPSVGPTEALLTRVLGRLSAEGALFREGYAEAPKLSINYGTAGAAYALYRIALAREDAELLSLADLWAARAVAGGKDDPGFYNPEKQLSKETLGLVTPYHSPSGPLAGQALVSHALGDIASQRRAAARFLEAVREPCENPDLTLGRSGVLLAASLLFATLRKVPDTKELVDGLRELGDGLLAGLWKEIGEQPPITADGGADWSNLGMAHGWAGYLYATLRWCRASESPRPEPLEERLKQLGDLARSAGRGLRWPWRDGPGPAGSMPGWCNGSAGFVHLWTQAHRDLNDPHWLDLAEGAAWNAWEAPDGNASLCCGHAGRAYALLELWKSGAGDRWLDRARDLGDRAAEMIVRASEAADSLYKGEIGVAVLAADLTRPEDAVQPFFGDEGWG